MLALVPAARAAGAGNPAVRQFIVFSDLHYVGDSHQPETYPKLGQDANRSLIQSAFTDAAARCPDPLFILCLGDVAGHENNRLASAADVELQAAGLLAEHFPRRPVFPVPGNNDSQTDHGLQSPVFLGQFADAWAPLIPDAARKEFRRTFGSNGWYAADLPGLNRFRILGLNSAGFDRYRGNDVTAGLRQLDWLEEQLGSPQNQGVKFLLLLHIPPGLNPYPLPGLGGPFWNPRLNNQFVSCVAAHTNVAAIFCGHSHMDEFRLIRSENRPAGFIHLAPSVSPDHYNNPAYQIFDADTNTGDFLDYTTYYLNLAGHPGDPARAEWRPEYSFAKDYHLAGYNLQTLTELENRLQAGGDNASGSNYLQFYDVTGANPFATLMKYQPEERGRFFRGLDVQMIAP
jgi:hypothetical protein